MGGSLTESNHASVRRIQRQYEARGLVSKITSHSAVSGCVIVNEVQRDYSPFGLLVSDWQSHSGAVVTSGGIVTPRVLYGYTNGSGNKLRRTSVTYPNTTRVLNLEYGAANTIDDHLGRIATLDIAGTNIAAYTYCGAAWQVEVNYPAANLELTFKQQTGDPTGDAGDIYTGYDRFGRAIDLRWRVASTNTHLERVQYGFDRADRRQWRRRIGVGTPFPVFPDITVDGEGDRYYRYDALGQVLAEDFGDLNLAQSAVAGIPHGGMRWSYDPTGNIGSAQEMAVVPGAQRIVRTYDKGNRITASGEGADPILTDRAGRITRLRGSDMPEFQMKWDAWGRLVEVKDYNNVVLGSYTYDGLHRRVKRAAAGVTWSVFYNDDWKPIEERRATHPTLAAIQYFWGARHRDDLIRRDRAPSAGGAINEIRYVLMDYFSPLAITTNTATITERYAFGAFGRRSILNATGTAVIASSTVAWEFGFHGQFRDSETGLYNYGYRYYVTTLGRFLSKDPIMEAGGLNLYRMAGNSAVNKVDLLGLADIPNNVNVSPSNHPALKAAHDKGASMLKEEIDAFKKSKAERDDYDKKTKGMLYHDKQRMEREGKKAPKIDYAVEHCGRICEKVLNGVRCGVFYTTTRTDQQPASCRLSFSPVCKEGDIQVGWWHIHPSGSWFSDRDNNYGQPGDMGFLQDPFLNKGGLPMTMTREVSPGSGTFETFAAKADGSFIKFQP
jgi:RHS repeat-associated protein